MTHSAVLFVIYALATYRLSRLVTVDSIFNPVSTWLHSRGFKQEDLRKVRSGEVIDTRTHEREGRSISRWFFNLTTCSWCVSVWLGGGVVLLAKYQGAWFAYVALALALSAVAGIVSERV
jgi:Protein of unknown function (DUF1360)